MEGCGALPNEAGMSPEAFRAFYRAALPDVYGYLLRLCAGDRARAEDLTQDVWLALVEELRHGRTERADIRWLITVARSKFLDAARRDRRRDSKLVLLRSDSRPDPEPTGADILSCLADLQPLHRAVLVLRYVDGLPVSEISIAVGRGLTATNSLLARARAELRRLEERRPVGGAVDG